MATPPRPNPPPPPRPEPPKPGAPKPGESPKPAGHAEHGGKSGEDDEKPDEGLPPKGSDEATNKGIPKGPGIAQQEPQKDQRGQEPKHQDKPDATPWTPPAGHKEKNPAPGEPGGPSAGGGGAPPGEEPAEPAPVHTIADEQRARSAIMLGEGGPEKYMQKQDMRTPEQKQGGVVPGVGFAEPGSGARREGARP